MKVYSMRGYVMLGALTPDQAAKTVFPNAPRSPNAGHNMATYNAIVNSARAGVLVNSSGTPAYIPGTSDCSATGQSSNVKLAQVSGSLALTGINVAAALSTSVAGFIGTALGPATLGISALIGLFPLLFGHHAAAVKKEQSVLCAAVPAANNYLQIIDDAVRTGKATPQQGIDALSSLASDFDTQVAPIRSGADPTVSGECNAACVMSTELKAVILVKQSQYQDLMATQPASSGPAMAAPVSSGSTMTLPVPATSAQVAATAAPASTSWLPIAALAFFGFFVARSL